MLPESEEQPALKKLGVDVSNKRKVCEGRGTTRKVSPPAEKCLLSTVKTYLTGR